MMRMTMSVLGLAILAIGGAMAMADEPAKGPSAGQTRKWANSPIGEPNFFPLCVWLQRVDKAADYKAIGINTYVCTWQGPTEDELAALKKVGMKYVSEQNEVALKHLDDPTIIAWNHEDEPDNARKFKDYWKGDVAAIQKAWPALPVKTAEQWGTYGPPVSPAQIVERYEAMKKKDPTRPILVGLGQGVAWEKYKGRGARSGHLEDYPEYIKGGDMVSFDIYPVVHDNADIKGKLEYVAKGVDRLVEWTAGRKPVFNAIECTHISNAAVKPTPDQVRSEVWMAIIHGSQGILYFCHQFEPNRISAALLADKEMAQAVGKINKQITDLAAVLNSPTLKDAAAVESSAKDVPIDILAKKQGDATYVFSVSMRGEPAKGSFTIKGLPAKATAEVLGEDRKVDVTDGKFADDFKGYDAHLYKVSPAK
jgi:hypothetical protein